MKARGGSSGVQRFPTYGAKGRAAQSDDGTGAKERSTVTLRAHAGLSDSFSVKCEESLECA